MTRSASRGTSSKARTITASPANFSTAPDTVDLTKTYDVLVVGSGAAGGMAAHALTAAGLDVLMLEAGRQVDVVVEDLVVIDEPTVLERPTFRSRMAKARTALSGATRNPRQGRTGRLRQLDATCAGAVAARRRQPRPHAGPGEEGREAL